MHHPALTLSCPDRSASAAGDPVARKDDGAARCKRRRAKRACDPCRNKKVRCDGPQSDRGNCSNCAFHGYDCTFSTLRNRAPLRSYVEALEARNVKLEHLITSLAPGVDFTKKIGKPVRRPDDTSKDASKVSALLSCDSYTFGDALPLDSALLRSYPRFTAQIQSKSRSSPGSSLADQSEQDSEDGIVIIGSRIGDVDSNSQSPVPFLASTFHSDASEQISLGKERNAGPSCQRPLSQRYFGEASAMHTLPLIERLTSQNNDLGFHPRFASPEFWPIPIGLLDPPANIDTALAIYPPSDLADELINVFFARRNRDYPVVNEAQFRHERANCPEIRKEPDWLALCFCIFAVGSLCLDDVRTKASPDEPLSCGMHWWQVARTLMQLDSHICMPVRPIRHIQCLLLSTIFHLGLPLSISSSWSLIGVAVRSLLDMGAHRKQTAKMLGLSRVDEETTKRVFWVAYGLDREIALFLGRPVMLQDDDIDVALPIEVDDDYLFNTPEGEPLQKQPVDKPAVISGFLCSLGLDEIVGHTLKTVYALRKTKTGFGISSKDWDARSMVEIDSALNKWLSTVPAHLRCDPHVADSERLIQSSLLYAKYHECQILVHRAVIAANTIAEEASTLGSPSIAICMNAARGISRLAKSLRARNLHNSIGVPLAFRALSACRIVIAIVLGSESNGWKLQSSAMTDLCRSIEVLCSIESAWQICGKLVRSLELLKASVQTSVTHQATHGQGTKRSHTFFEIADVGVEDNPGWDQASRMLAYQNSRKGQAEEAPRTAHRKWSAHPQWSQTPGASGQSFTPKARPLALSVRQPASTSSQTERYPSPTTDAEPSPSTDAFLAESCVPKMLQTPQRTLNPLLTGSGASFIRLSSTSDRDWATGQGTVPSQGSHEQSMVSHSVSTSTPLAFDEVSLLAYADEIVESIVTGTFGTLQKDSDASADKCNGLGDQEDDYGDAHRSNNGKNASSASELPDDALNALTQMSDDSTPWQESRNILTSCGVEILQKQRIRSFQDDMLDSLEHCNQQS